MIPSGRGRRRTPRRSCGSPPRARAATLELVGALLQLLGHQVELASESGELVASLCRHTRGEVAASHPARGSKRSIWLPRERTEDRRRSRAGRRPARTVIAIARSSSIEPDTASASWNTPTWTNSHGVADLRVAPTELTLRAFDCGRNGSDPLSPPGCRQGAFVAQQPSCRGSSASRPPPRTLARVVVERAIGRFRGPRARSGRRWRRRWPMGPPTLEAAPRRGRTRGLDRLVPPHPVPRRLRRRARPPLVDEGLPDRFPWRSGARRLPRLAMPRRSPIPTWSPPRAGCRPADLALTDQRVSTSATAIIGMTTMITKNRSIQARKLTMFVAPVRGWCGKVAPQSPVSQPFSARAAVGLGAIAQLESAWIAPEVSSSESTKLHDKAPWRGAQASERLEELGGASGSWPPNQPVASACRTTNAVPIIFRLVRTEQADLLEQAEVIAASPMLGQLAVCDAPDVDVAHWSSSLLVDLLQARRAAAACRPGSCEDHRAQGAHSHLGSIDRGNRM